MIYLDNAATALPLPQALEAAHWAMAEQFGNPSSVHALGREARAALEAARGHVAEALGCPAKCVVFTSGGTESTETALLGAALKSRHLGRHLVSTRVEHDATLSALGALGQQGFEVTLVPPGKDGVVPAEALLAALRPDTVGLSMQAVNNETGAVMPYAAAAAQLKARLPEAFFHLDGVQGLCELELELKDVDYASFSAHKIGGIKGVGALYAAPGRGLRPLIRGGGQEGGSRGGTEAMPAIAAFGAAARLRRENLAADQAHMAALRARLLQGLDGLGVDYRRNSPEGAAHHIINLSAPGAPSEVYIRLLSDRCICVSGGSACKRGRRSHVLAAMGLPKEAIDSALRVSLSPLNTAAHIDGFCAALAALQKELA